MTTLRIPFECNVEEVRRELLDVHREVSASHAKSEIQSREMAVCTRMLLRGLLEDAESLGVVEYALGYPVAGTMTWFGRSCRDAMRVLTDNGLLGSAPLYELSVEGRSVSARRIVEEEERYPLNHYERSLHLAIIANDAEAVRALAEVDETYYDPPGQGMPEQASESIRALRDLAHGKYESAYAHMEKSYQTRKRAYWEWYFMLGVSRSRPTSARSLMSHPYAAVAARDAEAVDRSISLILECHRKYANKAWESDRGIFRYRNVIFSVPALACVSLARRAGLKVSVASSFLPAELLTYA